MLISAPLFSAGAVTIRIRLGFAFVLTLVVVPLIPEPPAVEALSFAGLMIAAQEILIGVTIGFMIQLMFAVFVVAGHVISMPMSLAFAQMVDPQQGVNVPVVSSYFLIITTLMFLALNGHVALIELTLLSFQAMPVGAEGLGRADFRLVADWGATMFRHAGLVALPAVAALLLGYIALGVMTRAAPQLHLFAVGFPMTILLGMVLLYLLLPTLLPLFIGVMTDVFVFLALMLGV